MRVTRSMMVNNMAYWVANQADRLNDAQTEVGSGKKINKPSDNPVAAGKIISDRASISQYGQYELNIAQAQTWVGASSSTLDAAHTTLQNAISTVTSYLAGGMDTTSTAGVMTNYYKAVLSLANSSYASSYMYSGNLSHTMPFTNEVNITGGLPANIEFGLGGNATNVTIAISDSTGTVVRNITVGAGGSTGPNSIAWDGNDNASNPLPDGQYSFTITAVNGIDPVTEYPAYHGDTGGKEVLTGVNEKVVLNNNGGNIFSSILSNLSQAITAITNNASNAAVSAIGDALKVNGTGLEAKHVELSTAGIALDSANNRLQLLTTNATNRIADLETGSTEEAAIKLQVQQTTYEEVIAATGNLLKMSKLTDYL